MSNIEIIKYALEANLESLEMSEKATQNVKTGTEKSSVKNPGTGTRKKFAKKISASIKKNAMKQENSPKIPVPHTSSKIIHSRHIPAAQKRKIINKTDGKCTYGKCNRPGEHLHHKERFMTSKNHSSLIFLCKLHHEFMHNGLIKQENGDPKNWRLELSNNELHKADKLYRRYRKRL